MKRLFAVFVLACFFAPLSFSQDSQVEKKEAKSEGKWHGYVVDAMCAKNMMKKGNPMEKAAKHTKECALEEACASSGFGVFYDGKYYKFDEDGDKKAKEIIEQSATEKGLMVDVSGTMADDMITVASIAEMKMEKKEMEKKTSAPKKMEKTEEHKH